MNDKIILKIHIFSKFINDNYSISSIYSFSPKLLFSSSDKISSNKYLFFIFFASKYAYTAACLIFFARSLAFLYISK